MENHSLQTEIQLSSEVLPKDSIKNLTLSELIKLFRDQGKFLMFGEFLFDLERRTNEGINVSKPVSVNVLYVNDATQTSTGTTNSD